MEQVTKDESYRLVGRFMNEWSLIEFGLDRVISGCLELSNTQSFVFSKTLRFGMKIKLIALMIKALIKYEPDNKKAKGLLKKIRTVYENRNIIAHCNFRESNDGTHVQFLIKSVAEDSTGFTIKRFYERDVIDCFDTMKNIEKELGELRETLRKSSDANKLIEALGKAPPNLFTKDL